jgi:hypothetical protein
VGIISSTQTPTHHLLQTDCCCSHIYSCRPKVTLSLVLRARPVLSTLWSFCRVLGTHRVEVDPPQRSTMRVSDFNWFAQRSKAASASPPPAAAAAAGSPRPSHSEDEVEVCFIDDNSNASSPFSNQPLTPDDNVIDHASVKMPMTSPIDIATPTRNASSSPSSQGHKPIYHDTDSRTSAMMSGTAFDSSMGRGRQDSFGGAKPISMNNPNRNNDGRPRRESLAGSLVQGMSWGGVSVGSWIRDE